MNPIDLYGANLATNSGLLTATGTETVYDTTAAIDFCVDGKAYVKATVADGVTPTTDGVSGDTFTALTASQGCAMVWCLNAAGTVAVVQGEVETLDASGNFVVAPEFPSIPDTLTPFAYQVCKAGTTAGTIAFGTSNWDATGFTNAIVNVMVLPSRPQVA